MKILSKLFLIFALLLMFNFPVLSVTYDSFHQNNEKIISSNNQFINKDLIYLSRLDRDRGGLEENIEKSNNWPISFIIPGLGQALMGDFLRGLSFYLYFFGGFILIYLISFMNPINGNVIRFSFGVALSFGIYIWNIIDSYLMSEQIKNKQISKFRIKQKHLI